MSFNGFFHPNFMLQVETPTNEDAHHHASFHGMGKRSVSYSGFIDDTHIEEELSDDCSGVGEKKRRLNAEQVRALERSFDLGSKLEPERKTQLARTLGLKPRQIAIWFQNRRARSKTKQLEKDYELLKNELEAAKSENEALKSQNKKLQAELLALKGSDSTELINLNKETEPCCSNKSENTSEINLEISRAAIDDPQQIISFFPSYKPPNLAQVLHSSKNQHAVHDESLSNILCSSAGVDDQSSFWAWSDNQSFH